MTLSVTQNLFRFLSLWFFRSKDPPQGGYVDGLGILAKLALQTYRLLAGEPNVDQKFVFYFISSGQFCVLNVSVSVSVTEDTHPN